MTETGAIAGIKRLIARRLDGSPLALLLDIDGTVSPIAQTPGDAVVPRETLDVLRAFVNLPDVVVAAVTGRSMSDARRMIPLDGVWIVSNHGMEVRTPAGEVVHSEAARPFAPTLRDAAERLQMLADPIPGAIFEDKGWSLSVHYRQSPRSAVETLIRGTEAVAVENGLLVLHGKELVELRPPIGVNKGTACVALADRVGALGATGAVLYAGDDTTDEDAFMALRARKPDCVTVRVGAPSAPNARTGKTHAEFVVTSTDDLRDVLEWLLARRSRARSGV